MFHYFSISVIILIMAVTKMNLEWSELGQVDNYENFNYEFMLIRRAKERRWE